MAGLVVLGAGLVASGVVVTLWAVVDVAVTPWFTLHVEGWNKWVGLLIACVPVVGAAYWIHLARPRPGIERIVLDQWRRSVVRKRHESGDGRRAGLEFGPTQDRLARLLLNAAHCDFDEALV